MIRILTDIFLLLWLCAAVLAAFFVLRPSPSLAPFRTRGRAVVALIAIALGGGVLMAFLGVASEQAKPVLAAASVAPKRAAPPAGEAVRAHPERYLVLDGVTSYHGSKGAVLLTGGATNISGLPIADLRLTCEMSNGGADVGTVSAVVHSVIPVGHKLIFAAVNLGPARGPWDRHSCAVTEAVVKG